MSVGGGVFSMSRQVFGSQDQSAPTTGSNPLSTQCQQIKIRCPDPILVSFPSFSTAGRTSISGLVIISHILAACSNQKTNYETKDKSEIIFSEMIMPSKKSLSI